MEQTIKQIVNIEPYDKYIKITDADGIDYTFFIIKRDGKETVAYQTFKKLQIKVKDKVRFNYAIKGQYKNVMSFISKQ